MSPECQRESKPGPWRSPPFGQRAASQVSAVYALGSNASMAVAMRPNWGVAPRQSRSAVIPSMKTAPPGIRAALQHVGVSKRKTPGLQLLDSAYRVGPGRAAHMSERSVCTCASVAYGAWLAAFAAASCTACPHVGHAAELRRPAARPPRLRPPRRLAPAQRPALRFLHQPAMDFALSTGTCRGAQALP